MVGRDQKDEGGSGCWLGELIMHSVSKKPHSIIAPPAGRLKQNLHMIDR